MAPRGIRLIPTLVVVAAVALAPAAFGDAASTNALPANAVVRVADSSITRATFERWFRVAAASSPSTFRSTRTYDPPTFARCVAARRRAQRRAHKRQTRKSVLATQCKQEYEGLRDQVLQFLILEKWVSGEAAAQGVVISAAELDKAFRKALRDTFPKNSDFRRFLKQSGMTEADARFQVTFNTIYTKLRELAIHGAAPVTEAEVGAFYDANVERFAEPESRDLRVVLTRTRSRANAARAALERGQTWRHVARKYSIDEASRRNGGLLRGVPRGSQEEAFDKAVFRAPKHKLRGPIRVQFGYYVFEVLKVTAAKQLTLEEAAPAIREELQAQHQKDADDAFNDNLVATWRPQTICRAGYVTSDCANGPPPPPPSDDEYPDL